MTLLGASVWVGMGVLLQIGGPVAGRTVLLLLLVVLADCEVVVAVGAQEDPRRR